MTPVLAIPIILVLYKGTRPSRIMRAEIRAARKADKKSFKTQALSLFWQLDTIGLVLCVLGFGLFFVTITIANGPTSEWSDRESPHWCQWIKLISSPLYRPPCSRSMFHGRFRCIRKEVRPTPFNPILPPQEQRRYRVSPDRFIPSHVWSNRQWVLLHLPPSRPR
jgi:hypothetical protein